MSSKEILNFVIMLMNFVWVGVGGALGSILRFGASLVLPHTKIPLSTITVNFLGSLIIGIALANVPREHVAHYLGVIGFCGGFTTFSTFSFEATTLLRNGETLYALTYIALSLLLCLGAVYLGSLIKINN